MDYSYGGLPFVDIPAKADIDTFTMDYSYAGLPFVTNPGGVPGPIHLKTLFGIAKANIKTINGIAIANVKTINGVD
jgi:hypothetical protein